MILGDEYLKKIDLINSNFRIGQLFSQVIFIYNEHKKLLQIKFYYKKALKSKTINAFLSLKTKLNVRIDTFGFDFSNCLSIQTLYLN